MSRVMVVGANGALGKAVLKAVGPERGIAVTRRDWPVGSPFDHVALSPEGVLPEEALATVGAIVNAAGRVDANEEDLNAANVDLPVGMARLAKSAGVRRFVQVSSFSVYGPAERVSSATAQNPVTAYGRSKARGDKALLQLADENFAVECMRLPFLFDEDKPALVGSLVHATLRLPVWPVSAAAVERSMISYGDAGAVLAAAADDTCSGISHAADPQLFTFPMLADLLAEEADHKLRLIGVPAPLLALVGALMPQLHRRLFQSSLLELEDNKARTIDLPLGLEQVVRNVIRNQVHKPIDRA